MSAESRPTFSSRRRPGRSTPRSSRPGRRRWRRPTALGEIWRGLRRRQVFPINLVTGLLGFLGARDHLVPDGAMRKLITRHIEHERLEQMPLELHVIAVDVITGEEVRLSRGPALEAVMASAAIPAVLPTVSGRAAS